MDRVGAVLVDFDGTACLHDVGVDLLVRFGTDPGRRGHLAEIDRAFAAGEIGLRDVVVAEAATLRGSEVDLIAFAVEHCALDPTFAPFSQWLSDAGVPLVVVSDGFGMHVRPILEAAGLGHLPVVTNTWQKGTVTFGAAHPLCVGCGTCKKQAVEHHRERHGTVAFVGDGVSDRFGAAYADVTFAKAALTEHCRAASIPFLPFRDFADVRAGLLDLEALPGPTSGEPCPGWRDAS